MEEDIIETKVLQDQYVRTVVDAQGNVFVTSKRFIQEVESGKIYDITHIQSYKSGSSEALAEIAKLAS